MKKSKKQLLVVEDDPGLQRQLRWCFDGFDVQVVGKREDALACLRRYEPQVVTLDLGLPPDAGGSTEGFATLEQILALAPDTKVIMVTGNEERDSAVRAIGMGAYDFYQKPIDSEVLSLIVARAHQLHQLEQENRQLIQKSGGALQNVISNSPQMLKVCRTVEKIAPCDITTLILGASGTGKELIARALHDLSTRSENRFVTINCAAIPDALLESELFGYEKGAFTGATKQTIGKIEHANGGTLFLDEVGDLPLPLQAKLLRFLQERVIERLGGNSEISVDVRVVCATHQNITSMIEKETFREDLYYRISEVTINVPPLNERQGDAVLIARTTLEKFSTQYSRKLRGFSQDALSAIDAYRWPGNVRELENRIKRAVIMCDGNQVTADDLELSIEESPAPFNLREVRDNAERQAVLRVLGLCQDNISQAAEMLGVSRPTVYTLMDKFSLKE
ncbi:MAG: PEP-CTERM-box response regulator transcription factor [Gammaproteobacteria bacterium]|nr:PEP-CTERM-box response regulator transcription factor [Gammaproteobacteria bacterium]